jgi:hypothetical protein
MRLGRPDRARQAVEEAWGEVDDMRSSFCEAELLRLRGELDADLATIEAAVRRAGEQGAAIYRERALASAARLKS